MSGLPAFHTLPWDSELFGFPVARLETAALEEARIRAAMEGMSSAGVRLAYAIVPWDDPASRSLLEGAGAALVDRKLRYRKGLEEDMTTPAGVASWPGPLCPPALESLALASGHQSRFRTDPRVPRHVFPQLYRTWIRRSVGREIADEVLVLKADREPVGLVTLAVREGVGEIGLVAVAESHRGQGLGRRLMVSAESCASARGAATLEVVTQGANTGACALYAARGFEVARDEAVYHVWMEPHR